MSRGLYRGLEKNLRELCLGVPPQTAKLPRRSRTRHNCVAIITEGVNLRFRRQKFTVKLYSLSKTELGMRLSLMKALDAITEVAES